MHFTKSKLARQWFWGLSNFHLYFLLRLTRFLGFYPDTTSDAGAKYFDLQNGCFSTTQPAHNHIIAEPQTSKWTELINSNFDNLHLITISSNDRKILVEKILTYYQLHIDGFGQIKSHSILEEVLN